DQIATKLGIEKTALIRVRAGISYALSEAMDDGHCGLPTDELIPLAQKLLEVSPELVKTAIGLELQDGTVIADNLNNRRCIFLAGHNPSSLWSEPGIVGEIPDGHRWDSRPKI